MKKIATIAAVAALATLAACSKGDETVEVPANETAAANIVLNDDGSVNTEASSEAAATEAANEAEVSR